MADHKMDMQDPPAFARRGDVPVSRVATLADGTEIKLYIPTRTIEANPISRVNIIGQGNGYPKAGERFKVFFKFDSEEYAVTAFDRLAERRATLLTYKDMMDVPRYAVCL